MVTWNVKTLNRSDILNLLRKHRERIAFTLAIFLLCSFPSYRISYFVEKKFPNYIPRALEPGSPILVKAAEGTTAYHISAKPMSLLKREYYFGGVDLYSGNTIFVSGIWQPQRSAWAKMLFAEPVSYFVWPITVAKPNYKTPLHLRFPANVQRNVIEGDKRIKEEQRNAMRLAMLSDDKELTDFCWKKPIESIPVSKFASPRFTPDNTIYYHSGLDMRARMNTPVKASAGGEVRIAEPMIVPGKVVMLYHGSGLFSVYMHLNKILSQPTQTINKGDVIGLSGDTGRVEAPHLHWELRWKGSSLNPLSLVQLLAKLCDQG